MADTEVVIDGVTMDLPPNQFGAVFGWISRIGSKLTASVMLARRVEFASFNIADEIAEFNKAIKIFAEELKP